MASTFGTDLRKAVQQGDAAQVLALMNSVNRTRPHEKRALKMLFHSIESDKPAVTRALLFWGADANGVLEEATGETPLLRAVRRRRIEAARALIEAGADANQMDVQGRAPLHEANSGEIAALLLDAGADIEGNASLLWNPLSWACGRGADEVAFLLIERGATIEPENDHPLFFAASVGRVHLVQLLLERGARVRREFENGTSDALEYARKRRNFVSTPLAFDEVIALLEEALARQNEQRLPRFDAEGVEKPTANS